MNLHDNNIDEDHLQGAATKDTAQGIDNLETGDRLMTKDDQLFGHAAADMKIGLLQRETVYSNSNESIK